MNTMRPVTMFLSLSILWSALPAMAQTPAVTPAQVEADWLRQDELRHQPSSKSVNRIRPEEDAPGGCDGVKDGKWGFHTKNENRPWWQVDLERPVALAEVRLFNRCDSCASRNARILLLVSADANDWKQIYQHNGTTFLGHSDGNPAVIKLDRVTARYVRLQLPGKNYFHLDEVEIYPIDSTDNIALGKSATQSSTSPWSAIHAKTVSTEYRTSQVITRGRLLAESLRRLGVDVGSSLSGFDSLERQLDSLPRDASNDVQKRLYLEARWTVRRLALTNPLLDFETILFAKRAPPMFPHMSDQFYGWWSRGDGGLWRLEAYRGDNPHVRCLTPDWKNGTFLRPDISHDGRRVVFAYCRYYPHVASMEKVDKMALPEDSFFHLFEMNVDGTNVRQLTHGRYDDFDARYLPDGHIVFLSTRKGTALQCNRESAQATCREPAMPDSYVRCGGGNTRPVGVFTLHAIDGNGQNMRAISAFENFEWTPAVASDGRVIYARWDYIDRFNGPFMSLWSTNPDGTNPQLVYGNYTVRPQCVFEARPVPGSNKLVFTAAAHHSNMGGSLVLLDRTRGTEEERPLTRLTPEVCFPETEGWPNHFYANPYPLSEQFYLVSWSDQRFPSHTRFGTDDPRNPRNAQGIYLYDAFGNLELLYRDASISSMYPLPIRPTARPVRLTNMVDWDVSEEGRFLVQDVYQGLGRIERGEIRRLRIIGVPPKVQPHMNNPTLGVSREDPGKFVLGTVPVEKDGSAHFHVPSGVPVFFQALDRDGLAVQTMRSLTYVQPGQTLACVGCHESRDTAPLSRGIPLAAEREPSKLLPGPDGSWPLRFDTLVGPVLDRLCVRCHQEGCKGTKAAAFDLSPSKAYANLLAYGGNDLKTLAFEKNRSIVGDCPASKSKLLALLREEKPHQGVRLDPEDLERLITWMDVYAQRQGSFSTEQEESLRQFRRRLASMIEE